MNARRFTPQIRRETAAMRDFNPAYDGSGSNATEAAEATRQCICFALKTTITVRSVAMCAMNGTHAVE